MVSSSKLSSIPKLLMPLMLEGVEMPATLMLKVVDILPLLGDVRSTVMSHTDSGVGFVLLSSIMMDAFSADMLDVVVTSPDVAIEVLEVLDAGAVPEALLVLESSPVVSVVLGTAPVLFEVLDVVPEAHPVLGTAPVAFVVLGTAPPVEFAVLGTAPPVEFADLGTAPPVEFAVLETAPPVEFADLGTGPALLEVLVAAPEVLPVLLEDLDTVVVVLLVVVVFAVLGTAPVELADLLLFAFLEDASLLVLASEGS